MSNGGRTPGFILKVPFDISRWFIHLLHPIYNKQLGQQKPETEKCTTGNSPTHRIPASG